MIRLFNSDDSKRSLTRNFEPFLQEIPIDDMVNQIGTGKFHYKILFLIYLNSFQQNAQCSLPGLILPSLKKEFNLSKSEQSLYGSMEFSGYLIASLTIGIVSDKLGRRNGIIFSQILWLAAMFSSVFSTNIYVFSIFRCIVSTSFMWMIFSGFSLVSEIWPQKTRGIVLNCNQFVVISGFMLIALLARFLMPNMSDSDWRPLVLVYCLVLLGTVFLNYYLLEESPRYDLFIGQKARAFKTIEKMAKDNLGQDNYLKGGKEQQLELWVEHFNKEVDEALEDRKQENRFIHEYKKLFKGLYREITLTMFVVWTVTSSNLFGMEIILPTALAKMAEGTENHPLSILFYMNASLFPCFLPLIAMVEMQYFGRKKTLTLIFFLMGVGGCLTYLDVFPGLIFWLSLFKFSIHASFMILYLFTAELYPTHIRVNAIGQCSAVSRIGVIIIVWLAVFLIEIQTFLPFLIYGVMGFIAFAVISRLPHETLNEDLDRILSPYVKKKEINGKL